jgi:putative aminopeptidase FrvX
MSIINEQSEQFLSKYLNNTAPTGFEMPGQQLWLDYIKPYIHDYKVDNYGTVYGIINPESDYRVVIEAHADEIGWYVNHISKDGFIRVIRNGGSDVVITPSMRVNIHTAKGLVRGVFGWPAIHVRQGSDANLAPTLDNIFIDIGADSKEEVEEMGIHVGCVITFDDGFEIINNRYYTGRALDNRIGGFCIAEVARLLHENNIKLPFGLYIVNSVQEEVGLRGAEMVTHSIKPHVAIITDVSHNTNTPLMKAEKLGDIKGGAGPDLTVAPAVHNNLLKMIIETAREKGIPYQMSASSRVTGTDTDAFAYSNGGVPSALISLPLKYMHTTVEMAHKDDVENVIRLIYETIQKLEYKKDFRYFS